MSDIHVERLERNIESHSVRFVLARFNNRLVVQIFSRGAYRDVCDEVFYQNGAQLGAGHIDNGHIQWGHKEFSLGDHDHDVPQKEELRSTLPQIQQAIEKALETK